MLCLLLEMFAMRWNVCAVHVMVFYYRRTLESYYSVLTSMSVDQQSYSL